jgi:hypothetical protein
MLFRSAHKLLMDSATSEYLFCHDFWAGDAAIFREVFAPAVAAVDENLSQFLTNCFDISSIILMARSPPAVPRCTAPLRARSADVTRFVRAHLHRFASTTSTRSSCLVDARRAWTRTWIRCAVPPPTHAAAAVRRAR